MTLYKESDVLYWVIGNVESNPKYTEQGYKEIVAILPLS